MKRTRAVLSIDFDFWAEHDAARLDWGQRETPLGINLLWQLRLADVLRAGEPVDAVHLPHDEPTPGSLFRWLTERGNKLSNYRLSVVESHGAIVDFLKGKRRPMNIVNIDAHADMGYSEAREPLDCSNWVEELVEAGRANRVLQVYPRWAKRYLPCEDWRAEFGLKAIRWEREYKCRHDVTYGLDGVPKDLEFTDVFICRSGAWVPPWLDDDFVRLVGPFIGGCRAAWSQWPRATLDCRRELDYKLARDDAATMIQMMSNPKDPKGWSTGAISAKQLLTASAVCGTIVAGVKL
jgi:hypothetical protein